MTGELVATEYMARKRHLDDMESFARAHPFARDTVVSPQSGTAKWSAKQLLNPQQAEANTPTGGHLGVVEAPPTEMPLGAGQLDNQ